MDKFTNDLVFCDCDSDGREAAVTNFEKVVTKAMDIHAPIIEKDVTIRRKQPWFNDSIKQHKRKVQSLAKMV